MCENTCFFFESYGHHRDLHSFPTRRSSDLVAAAAGARTTTRPANVAAGTRKPPADRKSTRLNSSHVRNSYAVFCLKKKIPGHTQSLIVLNRRRHSCSI